MHLANDIDRIAIDDGSEVLHHNTLPAALPQTPNEVPSDSLNGRLLGIQTIPEPIAIVGMALRLPGGITSPESFWELLLSGGDVRSRVPASRYNVDSFYSPSSKTGSVKSTYGYFLENSLKEFDTSFFSMNKLEVEMLDPQQRQLLEVVWECMERAGQKNWRGKDIGCYVGVYGEDWLDLVSKDTQDDGIYRISGAGDFLLANRISYEYDLKGPR
jgi:acyl transferase domain-containing protein